jgi:rod shape-determining protein MreD
MNVVNSILILLAAFVAVYLEASFNGVRHLLGAQIGLLPPLIVYASLSTDLVTLALVAVLGGLWFDSLSANPLGVTMLPLMLVGLAIYRQRGLILREQLFAQFILGLSASAAAPALTLVLLLSMGENPLLGWGSLWQWIVMSLGGAMLTPVYFHLFDIFNRALSYRPRGETSFRADREIKRGR